MLRQTRDAEVPRIIAAHPELDPRGLGYAAIVTSEMFGIASSLDRPTQHLLEEQRLFASKKRLTAQERARLGRINSELKRLGFRFFHPDDEYSRYLSLRSEALIERFGTDRTSVLAQKTVDLSRQDRQALAKRLIEEMMEDSSERGEAK